MTAPGAPNVGVTFSVANQDPVLRAVQELDTRLRTVQATQQRTAETTSVLTRATSALTSAFGALGISLGVGELIAFTKRSVEAADAVFELSKKTGISAQQLSVLAFAAKQSGTDIEGLTKGLRFLGRAVGEALRGNQDVALSFEKVGLTLRDLQRLPLGEIFKRVTLGMQGVSEGAERIDVALHLFGARAGSEILPVLQELAEKGFGNLEKAAHDAAAVISNEDAAAAHEATAALNRMESSAAGLARTIVGPLLPALTTLFDKLSKLAGAGNQQGILTQGVLGPGPLGAIASVQNALDVMARHGYNISAFGFGPSAAALAGGAASTGGTPSFGGGASKATAYSKAELEDLAKLIELGAATTAERARAAEIEGIITARLKAGQLTLTLHRELSEELNTLTSAREKGEKRVTDEITKQAAEREAELARERLRAGQKAREEAAAFEAQASRDRAIAALAPGHFLDFGDFLARRQRTSTDFTAGLPDVVPPTLAAAQAATLRELLSAQQQVIDGNEQIGKSLRDTLANDLTAFFTSAGDGFRGLANIIIKSIQDIASQLLSSQITSALGALIGGGIAAGPGTDWIAGAAAAAAGAPGLARGGWIGGSGSGDTQLIRATPGEFMVNRASASMHAELLHAINSGPLVPRGFALGGFVGGSPALHGAGGGRGIGGSIHLGLDPGLHAHAVQLYMESDDGQRSVVNAVLNNIRPIRDTLRDYLS